MIDREADRQAFIAELAPLVGGTIVAVDALDDDDFYSGYWPVLVVKGDDGTLRQVEVSRDPEGNGPGHLFIGVVE